MFIPLGDDNSLRRTTPFVVYAIIAANVAMWLLQLRNGPAFTNGLSTVPYEISHGIDLASVVSVSSEGHTFKIAHAPGPHIIYLTLLTSMFMHGSWMHIIGNMVYLHIFGDQIEDRLGHSLFFIFYILCGLGAGAAQILAGPNSVIPCLGASGAIAGVLGAYLVTHPKNRVRVLVGQSLVMLPAVVVLAFWIALQFIGQMGSAAGQSSGVAYMAHIGGFVVGSVLVFLRPVRG